MNNDHHKLSSNAQSDEVFNGLSKDPLVDAGYGPVPHMPRPRKPQHLWRNLLIGVGGLIVVAGLVFGGVELAKHHKKTPAKKSSSTTSQSSSSSSSSSAANIAAGSNSYTSNETALSLSLKYPDGWTVAPATTTASGTATITVTSPVVQLTDASGAAVTGKAVVTIRPGSAGISELTSSSATVAQNSVQIGYTNPTSGQHKYPYITFIHLPSGEKTSGAFEEVMITGVSPFTAGSTISTADLAGLDPIISFSFDSCSGNTCTTPISINNTTWSNDAAAVEALNIFQSLQLN